jgi:hypothetical protein
MREDTRVFELAKLARKTPSLAVEKLLANNESPACDITLVAPRLFHRHRSPK